VLTRTPSMPDTIQIETLPKMRRRHAQGSRPIPGVRLIAECIADDKAIYVGLLLVHVFG
jgi:hypothetical protein